MKPPEKECSCLYDGERLVSRNCACPIHSEYSYDFKKYGFEWLDDEQIIMMVLHELLEKEFGDTVQPLLDELRKRFSEQRMHIPFHIRNEDTDNQT